MSNVQMVSRLFIIFFGVGALFFTHLEAGKDSSCSHNGLDKEIVFKANCKQCRIGYTGQNDVDFFIFSLPAYAGGFPNPDNAITCNDFSCKPIKNKSKKGFQVSPLNGASFSLSIPAVPQPGPVLGGNPNNHIPFLAYAPLQLAPESGELVARWVGSGKQLGVENQPFGDAVENPNKDFRLAYATFPSIDPEHFLTFDWVITNEKVYALIERLPGLEAVLGAYAAYTYVIPVYDLKKDINPLKQVHEYQLRYNKALQTMTWVIDGRPVFQATQFGVRLTSENAFVYNKGKRKGLHDPKRFQIFDHGGVDMPVVPAGLQSGIGLFNLIDGLTADNTEGKPPVALLRTDTRLYRSIYTGDLFLFNNPFFDAEVSFVVDGKLDVNASPLAYETGTISSEYRIFGQGARLRLFEFDISIEK